MFRAAALAAFVLASALAGPAFGATTERSTPYGAFTLIEEVRTADPGERPITRSSLQLGRPREHK
jgi:hypothetical protein